MKKIILFLLCVSNLTLFAQEKSLDIGINAGFGASFLYHNTFPNYKPKPNVSYSPLAGVSFVYNSAKNFSIMTDLNYENRGYSNKLTLVNNLGETTEELFVRFARQSFSVSVMPGFITKKSTKFFLYSGPSLDCLIDQRIINGKRTLYGKFNLGLDLKMGIQKQLTNKLKLNVFFQNRLDVFNESKWLMNSTLIGAGLYYSLTVKSK